MKSIPRPPEFFDKLKAFYIYPEEGRVFRPNGLEIVKSNGYKRVLFSIYVGKRSYGIFRYQAVWWKHYEMWPTHLIDHIDEVPDHDWIKNLQRLSHQENIWKNAKLRYRARPSSRELLDNIDSLIESL